MEYRMRLRHRTLFGASLALCGLVLTAMPALSAPAEGLILSAGSVGAITDRYVVVLKDGAGQAAADLTGTYGGTVHSTYTKALNGFSAAMTATQARRLAADPRVAFVEQDAVISIAGTQTNPPWGLDRIDQAGLPLNNTYNYDTDGSTATSYVLDTGIRVSHQEFGGRASHGYDFIDNDTDATDCHGHGTHVAGTIGGSTFGVAKKTKLVAVRVLNCDGMGSTSAVVGGIDWVAKNAVKPAVANMSLGRVGRDGAQEKAVQNAIASGVTFVLAAGNSGVDACGFTPAATPEAITVGATQADDRRGFWGSQSQSSNYGSCVDIWAPGTNTQSARHSSDTGSAVMSGTSMAAPHVAGAVARYLQANPTATPKQVGDALTATAIRNKLTDIRQGSPNLLLHTGTSAG
jgi:subtilisin family serine protease